MGIAAVAACGDSPPPGDTITVDAIVTLGPSCPVEREGVECPDLSLEGYELIASSDDQTLRRELTGDGRATLRLSAGSWTVTADAGMSCSSVEVTMNASITIECDTGIR
jgi:hypothetical protein